MRDPHFGHEFPHTKHSITGVARQCLIEFSHAAPRWVGHCLRKGSHQPPSLCNVANAYYFFSKLLYSTAVIIPQNKMLVKILSKCCRLMENKPLQNGRAKRNLHGAGFQILPPLVFENKKSTKRVAWYLMCNNTLVDTMKPQKRKWCIYSLKI